jgi:hypothetical protein
VETEEGPTPYFQGGAKDAFVHRQETVIFQVRWEL